jgi:hypothetical protein
MMSGSVSLHDDAFFFETSVIEFESLHDRLFFLWQHVRMHYTEFYLVRGSVRTSKTDRIKFHIAC